MERREFNKLADRFTECGIDGKIDIYLSAKGLTMEQYEELLMYYPLDRMNELSAAIREPNSRLN